MASLNRTENIIGFMKREEMISRESSKIEIKSFSNIVFSIPEITRDGYQKKWRYF